MMSSNVLCQNFFTFSDSGFFACFACDELGGQLQDPVDVVVVDVADHHQIDGQRIGCGQASRLADRREPRLEMRRVDLCRAAVDEDQPRILLRAVVKRRGNRPCARAECRD